MSMRKMRKTGSEVLQHTLPITLLIGLLAAASSACGPDEPPRPEPEPELTVEEQIAVGIDAWDIEPLPEAEPQDPAKVELGRMLFFDRILSGNLDTSCASCHHPREMTSDDIPLSAGTGAEVDGQKRRLGQGRTWTARNSTELFNRGVSAWRTQFWDMRIRTTDDDHLLTPAGSRLPDGLDNLLAAQAMFPVAERDEMRGERWDTDIHGEPNELGRIVDGLFNQIWSKLMVRLLENDEYRRLFAEAYPGEPVDEMGFEYAANAIAAFEIEAFSAGPSPWDRYVAGEQGALSDAQKRGAAVFFGKGECAQCHSGTLLTDQKPHNLAVPQFGPGRDPDEPLDLGFGRVSNDPGYNFAFRTPSLRNVALTPPYMHNGAYETIEEAIRHHLDPVAGLKGYDPSHLEDDLSEMMHDDPALQERILATLAPQMREPPQLTDAEVDDLVAFMDALTGEGAGDTTDVVPESVPSGLPLD
jgi:cytochrome c peroxidase